MVETAINLDQFTDAVAESRLHAGCSNCGLGSATGERTACGNGLERIYRTTAVRFGYMRYIGEFSHTPEMRFTCGAKVVIQTKRGIEIGEQVSLTCGGCDKAITRDQMKEWVASSGEDTYMFDAGRILREATAADLAEFVRIQADCRQKRNFAQQVAERHRLPLKVVECECPFGGERIIFYFTADERVDFRTMVKELAQEYRTRIEMRQIGARDEARLLADYETCGREVCCKVFLKTLKPISMRMAKLQKATLDPSQVSGRCGRLKCCLRYEHASYEVLDKQLPRVGIRLRTSHGEGVVVNRQILTQLVQIRLDNENLVTVVAEDIIERNVPSPAEERPTADAKRSGSEAGASARRTSEPVARDPNSRRKRPQAEPSRRPPTESKDSASRPAETDQPTRRRRRRRRRGRRRGEGNSGDGSGGAGPRSG